MRLATLEQALRARPEDRASWLAYAERLTERGDARGELIRLEQRREHLAPARRGGVEQEIAALVRAHERSWDAELPPEAEVLERRHGFAVKVRVEWSDRAPVAANEAVRAPFVTALQIGPGARMDDAPWHEDPDQDPTEPPPSLDAGALAALDLGRVTELELPYLQIGAIGARALAVSEHVHADPSGPGAAGAGRLEALDLRYCGVGDSGLAGLAESPRFSGVRRLRLQRNALTAEGVRALHRFDRLTELDLRYNGLGEEGVRALLAAPFAGSLRRLLLNPGDAGAGGARLLASATGLPPEIRSFWRSI
ncbi:TIGR02996 domain-containing protein [Nocardiopsis sp. CNT-189]|uniref:TIGR02996 domain-containing protein n=1 Tax=Nocardiopsis oceanisediminis TaxID=2816862 RepID=UPI003B316EF4